MVFFVVKHADNPENVGSSLLSRSRTLLKLLVPCMAFDIADLLLSLKTLEYKSRDIKNCNQNLKWIPCLLLPRLMKTMIFSGG